MRFVTQSTPYTEVELRQYAIQAIRLGKIKYETVDDEVFPTLTDQVLKGCRENKISNSTKKRCRNLEAKLMKSLVNDPGLWGEADSKGRKISETDIGDSEDQLTKLCCRTSP